MSEEKETTINGVDISECEFCITHTNRAVINSCNSRGYIKDDGLHIHINCKDNPNCYFKQLKRLERENEDLKAEIDRQKETIIYLKNYDMCHKTLIQYEKTLKEIRDIAKKLITETPEYNSCYYKDECGDKCTPKQQNKVTYCCYENVEKILNKIEEIK